VPRSNLPLDSQELAVDSQELAVDSQELAVDSQELAVDSQELAVRTGGCRVGVLDAGCPSLLPWHVPWTGDRQELAVRTCGCRLLRKFSRSSRIWTLTTPLWAPPVKTA
jgi:hypothetical protein